MRLLKRALFEGRQSVRRLVKKIFPPSPPKPELLKFAGREFQPGEKLVTEKNKTYEIVRYITKGLRSYVYQVKNEAGDLLAFKVSLDQDYYNLRHLYEEKEKMDTLLKYGFRHARLLEIGPDYSVKEWISGVRMDTWRDEWEKLGFVPEHPEELKALVKLIEEACRKQIYIGDLGGGNLMWDGREWVIIDVGVIHEYYSSRQAMQRYVKRLVDFKWVFTASEECKKRLKKSWESLVTIR